MGTGKVKVRKVPLRTCVACRTTRPKRELVRIVRTPAGELLIDRKGKVSGRGAYVCPEPSCAELAVKRRALERALAVPVGENLIAELGTAIEEAGRGGLA